jgi:hypothetical protein
MWFLVYVILPLPFFLLQIFMALADAEDSGNKSSWKYIVYILLVYTMFMIGVFLVFMVLGSLNFFVKILFVLVFWYMGRTIYTLLF